VDPIGQVLAGFRWRVWAGIVFATALVTLAPRTIVAQETNTICPVMTDEAVDPAMSITFRGKTVGFCCDLCIEKFKANPDKYLPRLPQFASAPAPDADDPEEPASDLGAAEVKPDADLEPAAGDRAPWWGRVHPVLVHFPLAGMPLALLGFLAWICRGSESFAKADVGPLLVATVASILAVNSGNALYDATRFSASTQEIVQDHWWYSERVMVLAIALSVLRIWRWNRMTGKWRWVYGGGLMLACGLLAYTGFLGGSLVFGTDHLKW
jgi:uncharacterized membrane protein/YHS domain-containing protein